MCSKSFLSAVSALIPIFEGLESVLIRDEPLQPHQEAKKCAISYVNAVLIFMNSYNIQ